MSVLACNRNGCENILCDFYSPQYGYICNECLHELKQKQQSIQHFMDSWKDPEQQAGEDWAEYIDRIFEGN